MEIKGIIRLGEIRNLTCCESIQDIIIGDLSLYSELDKLFNLDEESFYFDSEKESPKYSVRYIILEKAPKKNKSFEDHSAEVVMEMIYGEHAYGCYSEWTCGFGGFDYVTGKDGHSIFKELEGSVGKYIHFKI